MMYSKILAILSDINSAFDFKESKNFIEDGLLDSFDIITLVAALDKDFSISIKGTDIIPENFNSLQSLVDMLKQYGVKDEF